MNLIQSVTSNIESNATFIISKLSEESVATYSFLMDQYNKGDVLENHLFRFVFKNFFRMEGIGLLPELKTAIFDLLSKYQNDPSKEFDYEDDLRILYNIHNKIYFSFLTKVYSIRDISYPIYDSKVAKVFKLVRPTSKVYEDRRGKYIGQYKSLQDKYNEILASNLLPHTLKEFDNQFHKYKVSEMKKIDLIMWTYGKVGVKKQL